MTQEIKDTLYNKKAFELTASDAKYINKLDNKNYANFLSNYTFIMTPLIFGLFPLVLGLFNLIYITPIINLTMFCAGAVIGGLLGFVFKTQAPSYKELGLTKKEWKELKKSGRLKELKKLAKEYEQEYKILKLTNLPDGVVSQSVQETQNQGAEKENVTKYSPEVIAKWLEVERKSAHTTDYEALHMQDKLEELKDEETSLICRLSQIKEEKKRLEKSLQTREDRAEGTPEDAFKSAVEDCKHLNENLGESTFDN